VRKYHVCRAMVGEQQRLAQSIIEACNPSSLSPTKQPLLVPASPPSASASAHTSAPALQAAVRAAHRLRDALQTADTQWLSDAQSLQEVIAQRWSAERSAQRQRRVFAVWRGVAAAQAARRHALRAVVHSARRRVTAYAFRRWQHAAEALAAHNKHKAQQQRVLMYRCVWGVGLCCRMCVCVKRESGSHVL
jgi:hypothetical protein